MTTHRPEDSAMPVSTGEPSDPAVVATPVGPIVLMAVDGETVSESVVRTAHRLFGDGATYLAINVGPGPYSEMSWASVWPAGAMIWVDPIAPVDATVDEAADRARRRAETITDEAGLAQATPIGDLGDPAAAITRAAHHHRADVVVIGADERSWLSHLLDPSVERELLRAADFAVLVVPDTSVTHDPA